MTAYRYIFLDMRTDQVIEEIDLYGVYAQRLLNSPGQFNGSFQFDQAGKNNADLVAATVPGHTWLVMERIGVPVWWGMIWSRTYQSQSKSSQLYAWGFEAFPDQQRLLSDFVRTNVDEGTIFTNLWTDMIGSSNGRNLNINIPSPPATGIIKSANVLATDYKYYGEVMKAIANAADGFDWTVNLSKLTSGAYRKDLKIGYPTLGASSGPTFEYPGAILNYFQAESMSDCGTHIIGLGAGEGSSKLTSSYNYQNMVDQLGWPRWDYEIPMTDVNDQATLNGLTQQEAINRLPPMSTYTVTVKGNLEPVVGSYGLGDSCTLAIKDPMHPSGYSTAVRVIGYEIHPQSADGTEEVSLILPGDSVNGQVPTAGA